VHVAVVSEAVMYQGRGGFSIVVRQLVDGCGFATVLGKPFSTAWGLEDECVIVVSCQRHMLAGIASSRH
jgi:hypothetical protein